MSSPWLPARAAALTLLCATALSAQARDSTRRDSARTVDGVTVTGTRAPATVGGASAVVLKTDAVRSSPAPLLEEALRESPFVHVRQNSRGEMELSVRGSDSRQVSVIMDGVPLTLGWDHRTDPSLIPLTGAQELLVVRGLGTLLNGPNTLGGTVEITHSNATGDLGSGRMWGGAGLDENAAWVATVAGGREFARAAGGSLSLRAGLTRRERDGFNLPGSAPDPTAHHGLRTNSDLRQTDAFLATRWSGGAGRSLGLTLSGFDAARGVPPEEHITSPRLWRHPRQSRAIAALSANAGTYATPWGFGSLETGVGVNAGRLRIASFTDRSYSTVSATETGDERTVTGRVKASHTLPLDARLRLAATWAGVDYTETLPGDTAVDYRQHLLSAGTEIELPLGSRTMLAGGVVHDRASTPLAGGRVAQPPLDAAGWRVGLTRDAGAHARLHASGSRRSRFPALRELYSGALNRFLPNPDLRPETLTGVEAGFTVDRAVGPFPDATLQVNGFHHDLRDAVVRITLPAPDRRFMRVNRDRLRSTGVEMLGGLAIGRIRERAVSLSADATLQDIRIVDPASATDGARHAENNPEFRAVAEIGAPVVAGVRGFVNVRHTGPQYCLNADSGSEMRLGATTEGNLAAERRFRVSGGGSIRWLRALVALDNAGNTTTYDQCGLPQPGRTLRLMLSFQ